MKKTISIIGSTGSVGLTSLGIIDKKKTNFKVNLLSADKNFKLICKQIKKYRPNYYVINDKITYEKIKNKFKKIQVKILNNFKSIKSLKKSDITITAIPGIQGLEPTIFMIKKSKKILIANKESVICGWNLINNEAKKNHTRLIPIDSEHYSIFKLIENQNKDGIKKIYLTASGGPFLNFRKSQLKKISPKDALKHPKWKMGKKISVDSATMINKIFELVEAKNIFNLPSSKLDIIIHPNSLVHAILILKNGLIKLIYHDTSMIIPISNALFDGELEIENFLSKSKETKKTDKSIIKNLFFQPVDKKIFPIIKLKSLINQYPSSPIIISAANEVLVEQFLQKKIPFLRINEIIMAILKDRNYKKYAIKRPKNIYQILNINDWAKKKALDRI